MTFFGDHDQKAEVKVMRKRPLHQPKFPNHVWSPWEFLVARRFMHCLSDHLHVPEAPKQSAAKAAARGSVKPLMRRALLRVLGPPCVVLLVDIGSVGFLSQPITATAPAHTTTAP